MEWIKETFKTKKPIIAMCHVRALPGDPYYDADGGMEKIVDQARAEFLALQEGGVDAVMFSNEFSLPYLTKVGKETTGVVKDNSSRIKANKTAMIAERDAKYLRQTAESALNEIN